MPLLGLNQLLQVVAAVRDAHKPDTVIRALCTMFTRRQNLEKLHSQRIDADPVFVEGRPYVEIVNSDKELDVDLITMATHGRKGVSQVVFGSTAEKVVRLARCPVLTVKHPEHGFAVGPDSAAVPSTIAPH